MALNKTYAWYVENNKIALVEVNDSTTVDSTWASITTTGRTLRILATHRATDFNATLTDDDKTYNLNNRFRYILADYVIARGYEDPRNQDLKAAGYFLSKFRNGIRTIKKSRNDRSIDGVHHIKQHSF